MANKTGKEKRQSRLSFVSNGQGTGSSDSNEIITTSPVSNSVVAMPALASIFTRNMPSSSDDFASEMHRSSSDDPVPSRPSPTEVLILLLKV